MSKQIRHRTELEPLEAGDEVDDIYKWLDNVQNAKSKGNLYRDCSDGGELPALAGCALQVLRKLQLELNTAEMERLVEAEPGAVEALMCAVRARVREEKRRLQRGEEVSPEDISMFAFGLTASDSGSEQASVRCAGVKRAPGRLTMDEFVSVPCRTLLRIKHDLASKDSSISALVEKISHLENVMELKDQRIRDMAVQLSRHQTAAKSAASAGDTSALVRRAFGFTRCTAPL